MKLVYYRRSALRGQQLKRRRPKSELMKLLSDAAVYKLIRRNNNTKNVVNLPKKEVRRASKLLSNLIGGIGQRQLL